VFRGIQRLSKFYSIPGYSRIIQNYSNCQKFAVFHLFRDYFRDLSKFCSIQIVQGVEICEYSRVISRRFVNFFLQYSRLFRVFQVIQRLSILFQELFQELLNCIKFAGIGVFRYQILQYSRIRIIQNYSELSNFAVFRDYSGYPLQYSVIQIIQVPSEIIQRLSEFCSIPELFRIIPGLFKLSRILVFQGIQLSKFYGIQNCSEMSEFCSIPGVQVVNF
jgi:hypothetical protein